MKTKTRIATLSSKRFSRRIRIREKNEIAKNTPESIDIRKSADQFQQNEFLKLFDLESTCSSTDQSQGQQTNASYLNNSTNSLSLNKDCRGFPLTPVVVRKRSRSGNLKAFDQNKYDDMSTHLSKQILVTSTMSFDEQLYQLGILQNQILKQQNESLQNDMHKMKRQQNYQQSLVDRYKHTNEQLKDTLQVLQQQLQTLIS